MQNNYGFWNILENKNKFSKLAKPKCPDGAGTSTYLQFLRCYADDTYSFTYPRKMESLS